MDCSPTAHTLSAGFLCSINISMTTCTDHVHHRRTSSGVERASQTSSTIVCLWHFVSPNQHRCQTQDDRLQLQIYFEVNQQDGLWEADCFLRVIYGDLNIVAASNLDFCYLVCGVSALSLSIYFYVNDVFFMISCSNFTLHFPHYITD